MWNVWNQMMRWIRSSGDTKRCQLIIAYQYMLLQHVFICYLRKIKTKPQLLNTESNQKKGGRKGIKGWVSLKNPHGCCYLCYKFDLSLCTFDGLLQMSSESFHCHSERSQVSYWHIGISVETHMKHKSKCRLPRKSASFVTSFWKCAQSTIVISRQ